MTVRKLGAALATLALLLQGCYESLPLQQGVPPMGKRIELVLNDAGRLALGNKLGPAVEKVEGDLLSVSAESYELSVTHVQSYGGNSATWNGERVTVAKDQTVGFQVRQLDKTKTALVAAAFIVGISALFFGKSLFGAGTDPVDGGGTVGQGLTGSLH